MSLNSGHYPARSVSSVDANIEIALRKDPSISVKEIPICRREKTLPVVKVVHDEPAVYEEESFWLAWNTHREYLRRLSMIWMNVSVSDAEDALSDATIRAFEKYRENVAQITNERAWFARLLHNICIDIHRSNRRRNRLNDKVKEIIDIDVSAVETADQTPEAELMNSELGASVMTAINDLPEKIRAPLVMRLVKGEDYDYIAKTLGITNDNARKRVQQARAVLRRKLSHLRE